MGEDGDYDSLTELDGSILEFHCFGRHDLYSIVYVDVYDLFLYRRSIPMDSTQC